MKRKIKFIVLVMFVAVGTCAAAFGGIENPSFEADGEIDITAAPLTGWDVNIPAEFGGDTVDSWQSDGSLSLKIFSDRGETFTTGDEAFVSQVVDLTKANELIFDVNLSANRFGTRDWNYDGSKCTAFAKIGPNTVWFSEPNDTGPYYDVNVPVDTYTGMHTLSLGIRVDVNGELEASYWTQWDNLRLDVYCGGFGYLAGDMSSDCYVNFRDFILLAEEWLEDDLPADLDYIDLVWDGKIDLADFCVMAFDWMQCTNSRDANCVAVPLDLDSDLNLDGIVNFVDYQMLLADVNDANPLDVNDLNKMGMQWLQRSWLYGR